MSTLALDQLLNNKKTSSFIVVNDTIRLSALPLLIDIGKRAVNENRTLIVLLTETSPRAWRELFSSDKINDIFIVDCYSNPLGWDDVHNNDPNVIQVNNIKDMEKQILSPILKKVIDTPDCTILVDSIIPLVMISQHRTYQLVKALESLTTDAIRLVIGFHSDIKLISKTGLAMQDALNRLASTIIKLEPLKERTHFETQVALTGFVPQETFSYMTITSNALTKGGIAHIQWRKKSGKVLYESNGFIMNATTQFLDVVPATQLTGLDKEQESEPEAILVDKKTDPTANLSFNLSLTDEQRKTKESLVLPFMKAQQLEVSVDEEKKSGLIYYDPDAADDFDDEDPDEDLDI